MNEELNRYDVRRTRTREYDAEEIFSDEEVRIILGDLRRNDPNAYPIVAAIAMTGPRRRGEPDGS